MHDGSFGDLTRPRTLDDLLAETEAISARSTRGRRIFTAADLDAFAGEAGVVEVIDGTVGPRIRIPREPRVIRSVTLEEAAAAGPADYGLASPDAVIAREDARFEDDGGQPPPDWWDASDQSPKAVKRRVEWYRENGMRGLDQAARGARRVHGRSGNDKGPKARQTGGRACVPLSGPTKTSHEHWDDDRAGGKVRPVVVGARVTHESKDALDADQTASNGEVMETVAIVMRKTGMTKAAVLAAIERLSETGMVDPDVAEVLTSESAS